MTSKVSLAGKRKFCPLLHEILWTARRYWWVSLVGMALIFGSTYLFMHIEPNSPEVFSIISSDVEILPRITAVIYGIFAAFSLFRFLWDRRECVLTLSVGTQRWKQFTLRYLFGLVSAVLAVAVPMALAYCLEMRTIGDDPVGLCANYTFVYGFSLLVVMLLAYTVGVLVAVLCGRFLSALLTAAGVLAAPYALLWGVQEMLGYYLFGTPLGGSLLSGHAGAGLFTMLTDTLRWTVYNKFTINHSRTGLVLVTDSSVAWQEHVVRLKEEVQLPVLQVVLLLGLTVLLALLSGWAYCRRPAEHAGKAVVHPVLSHAVALTTALGVAGFTLMIPSPAEGFAGTALLTLLLALAFALTAFLVRLLLIWDCKATIRHYAIPCGGAVLCLVIAILLGTGWFGYASYVPDAEDVVSVRVTYNQNPTLLAAMDGRGFSIGYPLDSNFSLQLASTDLYDMRVGLMYLYGRNNDIDSLPLVTETADIRIVQAIHAAIIADGRQTYTATPADTYGDTVIEAHYRVIYQLKNGKTVERYYPYLSLSTLETTMTVEDTYAYRSAFYEKHDKTFLTEEGTVELGDPLFSDFTPIPLDEEEKKALTKALDTDVAYLTFEERYFNTGDPARDEVLGILRIRVTEGTVEDTHPFGDTYETYYLTAAYQNTLAFLEERGCLGYFDNDYTITDVSIKRYLPRFYTGSDSEHCPSYVFFSCDNVLQAVPDLDEEYGPGFLTRLEHCTDSVSADEWDAYIQNSRPVALMTRPGVMVQILLTNADGEQKLVTRYRYDGAN